jgi:putative aminophosphonate oxidoreductase
LLVLRFAVDQLGPAGAHRAAWLEEALAAERRSPHERLDGDARADVCIVGGGFTGLWTALAIKRLDPAADVVVLDGDICGGGASGRNGGFAMTWWSKFLSLQKSCGSEWAVELCRRSERAVVEIGRFCAEHGIAGFHHGGWLWTATNAAQLGAWEATLTALERAGVEPFERLAPEQVAARSGSPVHLAGVYDPAVAIVQPALLARGMAAVARAQGVRIHERSPATAIHDGAPCRVLTPCGTVTAERVVLALNAWAAQVPELARALVVTASDVVLTEPIPQRLAASGWERALAISDARRLVHYYRQTDDGRVAFGKGGGTLALGGRIGASFNRPPARAAEVARSLRRTYPQLHDVAIARSWTGPVDYSIAGMPFFGALREHPQVLVGAGFSGNGVGPSYVAGEVLAALAVHGRDDSVPAALTTPLPAKLPPEPLRAVGGLLVQRAIGRKERAEDRGAQTDRLTAALARLDPTSFAGRGGAGPPAPSP